MYFNSNEDIGQLYGTIWGGDATYIVSDLKRFLKGKTEATIHLHSPGGSVFDGNLIYNTLKSSPAKIHIVIDGLAASMGSIIMLAGDTISMAENAFVMIHAPFGYVEGTAGDMEKAGKLLQKLEGIFVTQYARKTGIEAEEIKKWLIGDNWFDAQEALANGLVDAVITPVLENIDLAAMQGMKIVALVNDFDTKFNLPKPSNPVNNNHNKNNEMKLNAENKKKLGVSDDSTDDQINAALEALSKENDTLKARAANEKNARIKSLIDGAVADGRITAKERTEWETLANTNLELASQTLAKLTPKASIPTLPTGVIATTPADESRKDWSFTDWSRKDTKGLLKMKKENPESYQALLDAAGIKL